MTGDARRAGTVDHMTTATQDPTATRLDDGTIRCACGAIVQPTKPGGHRPRPHQRPDTQTRCKIVHPTETICKRCGGTLYEPTKRRWSAGPPPGFRDTTELCRSPVFHPETWDGPDGTRYGNAAAAGALLGVSGSTSSTSSGGIRKAARRVRRRRRSSTGSGVA